MLFKIAFVSWIAWLLGIVGIYRMGDLIHIFFLIGGLFFLLAVAKARDAATARQRADARSDKS
jgi:hypothetical protein